MLKKITLLIIIICFAFSLKCLAVEYTENQKAIREVADAYYFKSINAQYSNYRRSLLGAPEESTSQHTIYRDCSAFIHSVYKTAFGIDLPTSCYDLLTQYAKKKIDDNINNGTVNDGTVVVYWTHKEDENYIDYNSKSTIDDFSDIYTPQEITTSAGVKTKSARAFIEHYNLQVGDILCWYYDKSYERACCISI